MDYGSDEDCISKYYYIYRENNEAYQENPWEYNPIYDYLCINAKLSPNINHITKCSICIGPGYVTIKEYFNMLDENGVDKIIQHTFNITDIQIVKDKIISILHDFVVEHNIQLTEEQKLY